jgi:hypothetical protein
MEPIDGDASIMKSKYTTSRHKNIRQSTSFDGFYLFGYRLEQLDGLKDTNVISCQYYYYMLYVDTKKAFNGR